MTLLSRSVRRQLIVDQDYHNESFVHLMPDLNYVAIKLSQSVIAQKRYSVTLCL